jgi:hypothetical protein
VSDLTGHTPTAFGAYLYRVYREHVVQVLANLPAYVQQDILELFARTFEPQQGGTGDEI